MIRKAAAEDLDAILAIEQASFPRPWSKRSFESELFRIRTHFLVWEQDETVAGYIIFWYVLDEAEIADVAVADSFKRLGIAKRLIEHCMSLHDDINVVHLEVAKDNIPAVSLYKKMGFIENGEIKDYYGAGRNAYRMSLQCGLNRGD